MGLKLSALRIIFVFVDIEEEVSLSFSGVSIYVFLFEDSDIYPVDAYGLSVLSDNGVTGNLYGNRDLFYLAASLYALACDPQLKRQPEEMKSQQTGLVRVTLGNELQYNYNTYTQRAHMNAMNAPRKRLAVGCPAWSDHLVCD